MRPLKICAIGLTLILAAQGLSAAESAGDPPDLVLVLSGGGARGAAHIGALQVLEEMQIVPDMIVGTSMGSIVGGLYAAGWSPEEIHHLLLDIDWNSVFTDAVPRSELSFRRKQDDRPYLIDTRLHFGEGGLYLPGGVLGGQSMEIMLESLEAVTHPARDFDRLPIPFRAVASDIEHGEPYIFDSGSLATAMRASMAIPGVFSPVIHDGLTLTDGGAMANLPVGIAQSLGAKSIIAVDISSRLSSPGKKAASFWKIFLRMNSLLTVGNRREDVKKLQDGDVYILPELGDINFLAFDRASETVEMGAAATRAKADELRRFSLSDEQWQDFLSRHRKHPEPEIRVDRMRVENTSRLKDDIIVKALEIEPPTVVGIDELRKDIMRLYHMRHSGIIEFRIDEVGEERELVIQRPEPAYGPNSLQFGLSFFDDFQGGSGYAVSARHQYLPANSAGGEWQNILQVGTRGLFSTDFYQPLDDAMRWFVNPLLRYTRGDQNIWIDGDPWTTYNFKGWQARFDGGRVLGQWGELRLGAFSGSREGKVHVGLPGFPHVKETRAGLELGFRVDTSDSVVFPRRGIESEFRLTNLLSEMGSDSDLRQLYLGVDYAFSVGEQTFVPAVEYMDNFDGESQFFDLAFLGGLGRLSGLGANELYGNTSALVRIVTYRRLKEIQLAGVRLGLFAGLSLEAGNVFRGDESVSLGDFLGGGGIFVGAETPIGPLYVGYGFTEGGRDRWYLAVGDQF